MSQGEVLKFLKRKVNKGRWKKTKQIKKQMKTTKKNIGVNLSRLFAQGDIERRSEQSKDAYHNWYYEWRVQ